MPLNLGQTNSWNSARSWRLLGTANVSLHNFSNLDYYQFTSHIHGTFGFSFHSCNEMSPWLPEFRAQTQPCKYNFTNIKKVFFFFFFAAVAYACSLEVVAGYSVIPTEPGTPPPSLRFWKVSPCRQATRSGYNFSKGNFQLPLLFLFE